MCFTRASLVQLKILLIPAALILVAGCGGQPTEDQEGGSTPGVDKTPPQPPVFTRPSSSPFTHIGASASYTITGTCASDVTRITGPGGITVNTTTARTWSFTVTLTTTPTVYSFTATDFSGNVSTAATTTIGWDPPVQMYLSTHAPGGDVLDGGTSFSMEATASPFLGTATHGPSLFVFDFGFNYAINGVRP